MTKAIEVDVSNEQVVIRSAIADEKKRKALVHQLSDSEFLAPVHAQIWRAMRDIVDRGLVYSSEIIRQRVVAQGVPHDDEYLADLEETASLSANLDWHVESMRWDATRARVLSETLPTLVGQLESVQTSAADAVSAARAILKALEGGSGRRDMHRPTELARAYKADVRDRMAKGNFWSSSFPVMDEKLTEGFMPRRTSVVVGLPGSGKSTWTAQLAIGLAKMGRRVLVCAWEMGAISTLDIMVCSLLGLDVKDLVQGHLTTEQQHRVYQATDWLCDHIRFMGNAFYNEVQKGRPNNDRNLDILAGYVAESGCDVFIMDLWERCLVDLSYDGITRALYRMQAMHAEYACHGIIVQQLRLKDVERRADKRPTRESIKGTGAYVEVADLIFGVHRDGQFKRVPDDAMEVICLKQRKGMPNWAVRFKWNGPTCEISGGVEVPYDPGLESVAGELGEVTDVSAIATKPRRGKSSIGRRDA